MRLVDLTQDDEHEAQEFLAPEEVQELNLLAADPATLGLHIMTRDGAVVRSEGLWTDVAPPVFSNVLRIASLMGQEFGETSRNISVFTENGEMEIAILPLSKADAVVIRQRKSTGGLANVR